VKWDTAWLIKQKLMEVRRQRNASDKLERDVLIDDAYLGGKRLEKWGAGRLSPFVTRLKDSRRFRA
jgi:hypothetical protein